MSDFHLVSSYSACGSLRQAIAEDLLVGKVGNISDAFDVGPLDDGRARAIFWQKIYAIADPDGYIGQGFDDAFSSWLEARNMVRDMQPDRVLIWASGSGSEYVFLRMACRMFADAVVPLYYVAVPPKNNRHAVAVYSPEELASMAAHARHLTSGQREALALEFDRIAARPELLRECDEYGRLRFGQLGDHDDLLVAAVSNEWQLGPRIIGEAMGKSDPRNGFGDVMLAARLRHLIESGVVEEEYRGEPKTWRNWYIRQKK
ncbi:DUF3658 domain-containing protein [Collimonas humicola]|uniref:DUF3658 domain-containing protein n=1 Tax=Collimonas humicola TaxID=2825886 RepID=UPI001B8D51AC|nr:DUF3658 domain-containing protein [Collimonas humicola]